MLRFATCQDELAVDHVKFRRGPTGLRMQGVASTEKTEGESPIGRSHNPRQSEATNLAGHVVRKGEGES